MLPPVQALSRSTTSYPDSANDAIPSGAAAAAVTSDAMVRVDREGGSAIAGRINNLLLSGRESMQTNLAEIADLVGGAIGVTRKDGESDAAFAQRFATALGTLNDSQRTTLQTQLNQALKGLQLDILLRVLQNTDGPEAALLSAYMEIKRSNSSDLKARTVVSSYSQNGASTSQTLPPAQVRPPQVQIAGQTGSPSMAPISAAAASAAAMVEEAGAQADRSAMPALLAAEASSTASRAPQVGSAVAQNAQSAAYPTEGDGTASETTQAGALAGATIAAPMESRSQAAGQQRLADSSLAASAAALAGEAEAAQTHAPPGSAAVSDAAAQLEPTNESEVEAAADGRIPGRADLPGKVLAGSDAAGTIAGGNQTVAGSASRTARADETQRAGLNTGSAAAGADQPAESTPMRTANRAYEAFTSMVSGRDEPATRPQLRDDTLDRSSTSVLALKGWMEVAVQGPHAMAEADKDEESDLLRQMFFQATEEPEPTGEDQLRRPNAGQTVGQNLLATMAAARQEMNDALPTSQIKSALAGATEAAQAGRTAASEAEAQLATAQQQERMAHEPAVLALTGAQALAHAIPVQVPQFVPLPIVSYLAMQDEAETAKTESVDAVEALNEDDPHQDRGGKQDEEKGEDEGQEDAEDDVGALSADDAPYAAISDDAELEIEQNGWQEPASPTSASILTLPAPTEDGFQAESLYWRIADLA